MGTRVAAQDLCVQLARGDGPVIHTARQIFRCCWAIRGSNPVAWLGQWPDVPRKDSGWFARPNSPQRSRKSVIDGSMLTPCSGLKSVRTDQGQRYQAFAKKGVEPSPESLREWHDPHRASRIRKEGSGAAIALCRERTRFFRPIWRSHSGAMPRAGSGWSHSMWTSSAERARRRSISDATADCQQDGSSVSSQQSTIFPSWIRPVRSDLQDGEADHSLRCMNRPARKARQWIPKQVIEQQVVTLARHHAQGRLS